MPGSARISSLISQHASNISSANVQNDGVSTLNFCNDVPYKNNEIKVEILDSEPTHILPDSTCKPACEMAVQKDDQDKVY
jgi:hypothetical protein